MQRMRHASLVDFKARVRREKRNGNVLQYIAVKEDQGNGYQIFVWMDM